MDEMRRVLTIYREDRPPTYSPLGPLLHAIHPPTQVSIVKDIFDIEILPDSLLNFWKETSGARLYEDVTHGQWGLVLFSPQEAIARSRENCKIYPEAHRPSDLVIGEFLGDTDILFTELEVESPNFGAVYVASPLDPRSEWPKVGNNLADFLNLLAQANGEKFWESH